MFSLVTVLLPLLLALIPLHPLVAVDRSAGAIKRCSQLNEDPVNSYRFCSVGGGCCPINQGFLLDRTSRCTLSGDSCYQPVLGNWGLAGMAVLLAIGWCLVMSCCGRDCSRCDEQCVSVEQAERQRQASGEGQPQYQRMSEVVEMR